MKACKARAKRGGLLARVYACNLYISAARRYTGRKKSTFEYELGGVSALGEIESGAASEKAGSFYASAGERHLKRLTG
ncbi:MAG: hypothetical protein LBU32_10820 [Clostridiales bacterium]|nr:hypothetical protein [Clostridiales bacterium]